MYALACGPDPRIINRYTGCIINGIRFLTSERDSRRKSQNSGVMVEGMYKGETIDFYGVLKDIIELQYIKDCRVILFQCDWFNLDQRKNKVKRDGHFLSINTGSYWYKDDPFVIATQVKQVFYVSDTKFGGHWKIVQRFNHRHVFDVPEVVNDSSDADDALFSNDEVYQENEPDGVLEVNSNEDREGTSLNRVDIGLETINSNIVLSDIEPNFDATLDEDNFTDDTLNEYCEDDNVLFNHNEDEDDSDYDL